jgi:hypothetical protein
LFGSILLRSLHFLFQELTWCALNRLKLLSLLFVPLTVVGLEGDEALGGLAENTLFFLFLSKSHVEEVAPLFC